MSSRRRRIGIRDYERESGQTATYTERSTIFFTSSPIELYELIAKLADNKIRWKLDGPIVWTLELVRILETSEDNIMHTVVH